MNRRAWTPIGLVGVVVLTLILQLTIGKNNTFGFACFIVFVLALIALVVLSLPTIVRHRSRLPGADK